MLSVSLYFLPIGLQLIAGLGFYLGGPWAYMAIGSFPVLMLIDSALPRDFSRRQIDSKFLANAPLYIATFCGLGLYFVFAWRIGEGTLNLGETIGAVAGMAWLSVVPMVPVTHELYHQRGAFSRFLGLFGQIVYFDGTRSIAHVIGHHIDVATPEDLDTARRGMDLYRFTAGALARSTKCSLKAECDALEKKGKGRWSIGHRLYKAIAMMVIMQVPIYLIGGWKAVGLSMLAMFIARVWAEVLQLFPALRLDSRPRHPDRRPPRLEPSPSAEPHFRLGDHQPSRPPPRLVQALLRAGSRFRRGENAQRLRLFPGRDDPTCLAEHDRQAGAERMGPDQGDGGRAQTRARTEPRRGMARLVCRR